MDCATRDLRTRRARRRHVPASHCVRAAHASAVVCRQVPDRNRDQIMAAIFGPASNLAAKITLLALAGVVLSGAFAWIWWPRTDYARNLNSVVDQPIPFSHQHHVAGLGLDCRFCHTSVETSANAGLPPTSTCMTCHSQIWTNAALLAPVRESLARNTPIIWRRVTDLPDYAYFNHSIHIAKGVGCES